MRDDNWVITNQGIGVCIDGFIIDGGNRIRANMEAGYPSIPILMVLGLPAISQKYVDTSMAKRSMADTLKLVLDINVSTLIVASINVLLKVKSNFTVHSFSADEVANFLMEHRDKIVDVISMQKAKNLPAPIIAACVHMMIQNKENRDKVLTFINKIVEGEMLKKGDPAFAFRNWMLSVRGSAGGANIQRERFYKTISALNAYLDNRRLTRIYTYNKKVTPLSY